MAGSIAPNAASRLTDAGRAALKRWPQQAIDIAARLAQPHEHGERKMIVVTGSVTARKDTFDEVRRLSLEHVHRSRTEPGCISHAVHVDCEDPLKLVFFEQWADRAALLTHFAVPASRGFVKQLQSLAASATTIEIYDATKLDKL